VASFGGFAPDTSFHFDNFPLATSGPKSPLNQRESELRGIAMLFWSTARFIIFSALSVPLRSDADLICLDRLTVIGVVYCGLAGVTGLPSSVKRATAPGAGVITSEGRAVYVPELRLNVGGSNARAGAMNKMLIVSKAKRTFSKIPLSLHVVRGRVLDESANFVIALPGDRDPDTGFPKDIPRSAKASCWLNALLRFRSNTLE